MGLKLYFRRALQWILTGIPEKKIFLNPITVNYGEQLTGKNIVITGGGSGIGKAIAKKCSQMGGRVVIVGRNEDKLKTACRDCGNNLSCCVGDVSNFKQMDSMVSDIIGLCDGRIDILINNAGVFEMTDIYSATEEIYDQIFDINMKGVFFLCKKLLPYISSGGNILMTASQTAYIHKTSPYNLSKAALVHFTRALAKELREKNIRVNAIAPGMTLSNLNINTVDTSNGWQRDNGKYRIYMAEEIANVACFLISDEALCINGEILCCDEGESIR